MDMRPDLKYFVWCYNHAFGPTYLSWRGVGALEMVLCIMHKLFPFQSIFLVTTTSPSHNQFCFILLPFFISIQGMMYLMYARSPLVDSMYYLLSITNIFIDFCVFATSLSATLTKKSIFKSLGTLVDHIPGWLVITWWLTYFNCGNDNLPLRWENWRILITPNFLL